MVALAVNLRKRHQAMSHACSHTKSLHIVQFVVVKKLARLANFGNKRNLDWPVSFDDGLGLCMLGHLAAHL